MSVHGKAAASGEREAFQRSAGRDNNTKEVAREKEERPQASASVKTWHVVALSGGKDSTALALRLAEIEPREYLYVCTPAGDEPDEMWEWWKQLGVILGSQVKPIVETNLKECIARNKMLPNFRARFCTRQIKIEPYRRFLKRLCADGKVISYVGLRADEEGRAGGAYDDIEGVESRFPFREWGWTLGNVLGYLMQRDIVVPERTGCRRCYHQRIGEWWRLWANDRETYLDAEADEERIGGTYRTPGRDSWATGLKELRLEFESGKVPKEANQTQLFRPTMTAGGCRVCAM